MYRPWYNRGRQGGQRGNRGRRGGSYSNGAGSTASLGRERGKGDRNGAGRVPSVIEALKGLQDKSPDEIVNFISEQQFAFLFDDKELKTDVVELTVKLLAKACDCEEQTYLPQLFSKLPRSCFLTQHVGPLLNRIATRKTEALHPNDINVMIDMVKVLDTILQKFPHSYADLPLPQLFFAAVTHADSTSLKDEDLTEKVQKLMELRRQKVEELKRNEEQERERKRRAKKALACANEEDDPPEPFFWLEVVPTNDEILSDEEPFLRKNKLDGRYKDSEHYLDVQFRLLREDFVRPLRKGIRQLLVVTQGQNRVEAPQDIRVYENVKILESLCTSNGVVYRIRFDTSRLRHIQWENSKRLIYGSLLCLSKDNFKSFVFASVSNSNFLSLHMGCLEVQFISSLADEARPRSGDTCQMVESIAFFEAYRPVLEGLQTMSCGREFPFQRYIVECEKDVKPPAYLTSAGQLTSFDFTPITSCLPNRRSHKSRLQRLKTVGRDVPVLDLASWPSANDLRLDDSQFKALQLALTQEFAIIQGPPGTGKTYIGLKIAEVLLHNKSSWRRKQTHAGSSGPILVVCFTNHALDQFLEGIHQFHPNGIVRVGGRSQSEVMQKCSLRGLKRKRIKENLNSPDIRRDYGETRKGMETWAERLQAKCQTLEKCTRHVLHERGIERHATSMTQEHYSSLTKDLNDKDDSKQDSAVLRWLQLTVDPTQTHQRRNDDKENGEQEDKEKEEEEVEREKNEGDEVHSEYGTADFNFEGDVMRQQRILETDDVITFCDGQLMEDIKFVDPFAAVKVTEGADSGDWQIQYSGRVKRQIKQTIKRELSRNDTMSWEESKKVKDVWSLAIVDRWRLYHLWLADVSREYRMSIFFFQEIFDEQASRLKRISQTDELEILKKADVVGMTTTGAARYHTLLQRLEPKITIVEEAAEVLEAHTVTSLTSACEHVILIGDHQQLRPNPTNYDLVKRYNLDVSLFERMVKNGMPFARLRLQHRMRPEIAQLLDDIYTDPKLENHEHVLSFPSIKGVAHDVFFLDHNESEDFVNEGKSKCNLHEARFLTALCRYLIQQGYEGKQITILTAYVGQLVKLKKEMSSYKRLFEGVRVTAVDNFQGEENDIILLSLVRSNDEDKIGFLNIENRVCVALSRAKMGFYCIGNFGLLSRKSELWRKIIEKMQPQGKVGTSLTLICQNHPKTMIQASRAEDFKRAPEGGCSVPCATRLECGHVCHMVCHPIDPDHVEYKCIKPCTKTLCTFKHNRCRKRCYQICNPCMVLVEKSIPSCGHVHSVPCFREGFKAGCLLPRKKSPLCGHGNRSVSHVSPRPCKAPCRVALKCGHQCTGDCSSCFQGRLHVPCKSQCSQMLSCARDHRCSELCTRNYPACEDDYGNGCHHTCEARCQWQCKHKKCTKLCGQICDRTRCNEPCREKLSCKHPCIGLCGETCPEACRVCDKDQITEIATDNESNSNARFVELEDCGHLFKVEVMDQWMDQVDKKENEAVEVTLQLKCCPMCNVPIRTSQRYGNVIKTMFAGLEAKRPKSLIKEPEKGKLMRLRGEVQKIGTFPEEHYAIACLLRCTNHRNERVNVLENQLSLLQFLQTLKAKIDEEELSETGKDKSVRSKLLLSTTTTDLKVEVEKLKIRVMMTRPWFISEQELEELNEEKFRTRLLVDFRILNMQLEIRGIRLGVMDTVELEFVREALESEKTIGPKKRARYAVRLDRLRKLHGLQEFYEETACQEKDLIVQFMGQRQ